MTSHTFPTVATVNRWCDSPDYIDAWRAWVITDPDELAVVCIAAIGWAPIMDADRFPQWLTGLPAGHPALTHLADVCDWCGTEAEHDAFHLWLDDPDASCWNCPAPTPEANWPADDGMDGPSDDRWQQSTLERWAGL